MEMNTRLQVEHPVTEEITGQDLVEWQLRVASGEKLPKRQDELSINGHAIEARLYAEDPAKGFLPSVGKLEHFDLGEDGRIETGVEEGDAISPYYDPMIAKLIDYSADRSEALAELAGILESVEVWPVRTNAGFLARALRHPDFDAEKIDTGFIERNVGLLVPKGEPDEWLWEVAAVLAAWESRDDKLAGFRLNAPSSRRAYVGRANRFRLIDLPKSEADLTTILFSDGPAFLGDEADGDVGMASGVLDGDRILVFADGQAYEFQLASRGTGTTHGLHDGEIEAPMPGKVTAVEVSSGEKVAKGQRLLTLEAMKMEHALTAPFDGIVAELNASAGAQVTEGQLLVRVESHETSSRT
jgi:3-methylcrotonyl-CoA carboxylase alpha subunit